LPELPEVETVRRGIAPALEGRRLEHVEISDIRLTRPEDPLIVASELTGERVERVDRRGKYLIVGFASGRALLIHLRMTGSLRAEALAGDPHRRALLTLDDGSEVAYRDVRRFGTWLLLEPGELEPYLGARLGEEPLVDAFTARGLGERLEGRRAPLKAALLDQRTLAGLGNIYVDEALWYAKLHPVRAAGSLDREELRRLHRAIRKALALGIARQGSTLTDYRLPDGSSGSMQREFRAYGRGDEPCDRCGAPLVKIRVAGRGTWFCPRCQVMPERSSRDPAADGPLEDQCARLTYLPRPFPFPGFSPSAGF
jgi:formamidopyrimidine-DNA glycosylase